MNYIVTLHVILKAYNPPTAVYKLRIHLLNSHCVRTTSLLSAIFPSI